MQNFLTIVSILLPMLLGFCLRLPAGWLKSADRLLNLMIYLILLLIGSRLAQVDNLWRELGGIAFYTALLFALLAACNAAALLWYDRRTRWLHPPAPPAARKRAAFGSIGQIGAVAAGAVLGRLLPPEWQPYPDAGHHILMAMMLLVGLQLRGSGIALRQVLLNRHGLNISLLFVLSCLAAGGLFALLLPQVPLAQGLALSSGYGWYSLSGIMMTEAYGAAWGSVALLNDLLRELAALALIPPAMRRALPAAAIGSGGATSMDFMLPLIQKHGGAEAVPAAVSFGFVTNLLSPVLMALFSAW